MARAPAIADRTPHAVTDQDVAGNGLLSRRVLLAGAAAAGAVPILQAAPAPSAGRPEPMQRPGTGMTPYGKPGPDAAHVVRERIVSQPGTTGSGASSTPLQHLEGTITPSGLHFERHHSGVPAISANRHRLLIHGLVDRPLTFDMASLSRYPRVSRHYFLECSGNSGLQLAPEPPDMTCGELHGLVSGSEWSGVPLHVLLNEAGVSDVARWIVAEGADAAAMNRSMPLEKALDDVLLATHQNGEPLRPENGYPLRLFVPGWEGNLSIKWLRRLEVTTHPAMSREETSKYSDLMPDGSAQLFTFPMDVKSVITSPSPQRHLHTQGVYQISGLAWSGAGRIRRVEVTADGGRTWADALLDEPVLPHHLTRFRIAWRWNGAPSVLASRATDEHGDRQPPREEMMAHRARANFYHVNAIAAWRVGADGSLRNTYV